MSVHEYPIRYSLSPVEKREIALRLRNNGGATDREIKGMCRHYGVAKKVIGMVLQELHLSVLPPTEQPQQNRPRHRSRPSPMAAAEALFKPAEKEVDSSPAPSEYDGQLKALVELEESMKAEQEKLLKSLEDMEAEMRAAKEQAEADRVRAENAIQQTRRLRQETRSDREELESLRGEISSAERRFRKQKERADFLSGELKASVKREKALVKALIQSETDLAKCRG